jgi:hypothetical protein
MMKFFRKYNKQLLAFFMALLMIVFIGGSALEGLLRPDPNFEIAKSNLGSISQQDQRAAVVETDLLMSMGQNWQNPLFSSAEPLTTVDWLLLSREAEKLGIATDDAAIRTNPGFDGMMDQVRIVAHNRRVKPDVVVNAMAKLHAIRQAAMSMAAASTPSEAEIISAARNSMERVKIRAVLLPAEAFVDKDATFSDEEINAHFNKYRDRELGPGIQFGYYRQPSIKVQYIKVDRDAIASKLKVPNEDRKAKTYYEENREKDPAFRRKPEELAAAPEGPEAPPYVAWEQAKETAITKLRKDYADENVQKIVDWLLSSMTEPWLGIAPSASGYKPAPAEVADLEYYDRLVKRLPPPLQFENSVTVNMTDFFTQQEASKVPELGPLSVRSGQSLVSRSFGAMVFNNEAIVSEIPKGDKVNASEFLAKYQTAPFTLSDPRNGNAYVFRVVDSRPGGPAESIDQVRDEVIADLRLQKGFEAAKARAQSLRACCQASEILKDAYEADPDLAAFRESGEGAKTGYFEPPAFSRIGQTPAWKGRPADGVFVGGGLGKLPNAIIDAIFALTDAADKLAVFELPDRAAVMTVEWVETIPAQEEEFAGTRKSLATQLSDNRWREFVDEWFDPEKIRARSGFQLVTNR